MSTNAAHSVNVVPKSNEAEKKGGYPLRRQVREINCP